MSAFQLAALCAITAASGFIEEPQSSWVYEARSNLYAAPLIADIYPAPGLETVVSDSDVRVLRCIDARGIELWNYRGPWTKRLTGAAALTTKSVRSGTGTIAIANGNGVACLLDAQSGTELGCVSIPGAGSGNLSWCDIDNDDHDELIVAGSDGVVRACRYDGSVKWSSDTAGVSGLTGPISTFDIDGDKYPEIVSLTRWGVVCVSVQGGKRWSYDPTARFIGAPIVYRNGERVEVACVSRVPAQAYALDAATGEVLWRAPLLAPPDDYSAAALAAGDIDGDGVSEVIVCDGYGHIHCFSDGTLKWVVETQLATNAMATIGDIDGDAVPEVLVTGADRGLYCITARGDLLWRYQTGLRMLHPATIADVDLDGKTDFVFGGGDRLLRCVSLGAAFHPQSLPWPSRRVDASLSGAQLHTFDVPKAKKQKRSKLREIRHATGETIATSKSLLVDGAFERALIRDGALGDLDDSAKSGALDALPNGWALEGVSATMQREPSRAAVGKSSVRLTASKPGSALVSNAVRLDDDTIEAIASARAFGVAEPSARLRWIGGRGIVREDALKSGDELDGWRELNVTANRPRGVTHVQLVLGAAVGEIFWDEAQIVAQLMQSPSLSVFVNQVGYDVSAPKHFVAQANFPMSTARFALMGGGAEGAFDGILETSQRIVGAFASDWGYDYARGDFSAFATPGTYRVRVMTDTCAVESPPFAIAENLLWEKTAEPAYKFFYYQRCGCEVPGFHGACHLDDAIGADGKQYELWGGWHDAGDYNTYSNAPYVYGLLQSFERATPHFQKWDSDQNGRADFLDEILWGGDHTRRMIAPDGSGYGGITSGYGFFGAPEHETDNVPGTGDERPIGGGDTGHDSGHALASVARIARLNGGTDYLDAAQRAYRWRMERGSRDALQLHAALDLFVATKDPTYETDARAIVDAVGPENADLLREYDALFGADHGEAIRASVVARAEALLPRAKNPFGVYHYGTEAEPNYFGTPYDRTGWHVGNSSHILEAAAVTIEAYAETRDERFRTFAYDQLNWILGVNPFGLCLMEGVGTTNPPTYHHRYVSSGVPRGAVPGSVVNGITWRGPGEDKPHFDMRGIDVPSFEPNECWLPHNTNYLQVITRLRAADGKF